MTAGRRGDFVLLHWSRTKLSDGRAVYSCIGHWMWAVRRDPDGGSGWVLSRDGRPWQITTTLRLAKHVATAREREYLDGLPTAVANLGGAERAETIRRAASRFQAELTRTAPAIGAVLDRFDGAR